MSVNKNFVVKNGLEVNTDLILADADTNKVGIASTSPRFTLDVRGGIGATDIIASGIGTFVTGLQVGAGGTILSANSNSYIGINTTTPAYLLDVRSSNSAVTAAYVKGNVEVTGLTTTQDLTASRNLSVSGISTFYNNSLGNVTIGAGNTALLVSGDARVAGILTIGSSSITIDGINNKISVGIGFTITSDGIQAASTGINTIPNIVSSSASITNLSSSGISTLSNASITNLTSQNINNTGITTLGITSVTNLTTQQLNVSGVSTLGITSVTNLTTQQLNVSGVSTLGVTSVTNLTSQNINVSGVVTATTFFGNLTGTASTASASSTAYGLTGNPDIIVGFATVNNDLVVSGNLTVNGTQTIINTNVLDVKDINVGIASTSTKLSNSLLDGAGITIYGSAGDKTLSYSNSKNAFETNIPIATNELRVLSGAEKIVRIDGNTATINYNTTGSNVGLCTNPSGNITLNVNNIPTTSDFDDYSITFAVIVNSTGTARTCTAVNLNGVSRTIKWAGGSLSNSISGVTTTNGYSIYNFTGINTVGSASTTSNYEVFGSVAGGFY